MYSKSSFGIKISAEPVYLEERSSSEDGFYVWMYNIRIENNSETTVQLLNRFWHITDAIGKVEKVEGPGVIGQQPVLKPGQFFEYSSGTNLKTSSGIMKGSYQFQSLEREGEFFEVEIPAFSLDSPHTKSAIN